MFDSPLIGGKYTKVKAIGKGSFGTVWLVRDSSGCVCVMKAISLRYQSSEEKRAARNEVMVLQQLDHPHLVRYVDSFIQGDTLCICMDYADAGDLAGAISDRETTMAFFPKATVVKYAFQLCSALAHCHHILKLLHRDIKPANCFLTSGGNIKLGDFGISKMYVGTDDVAQTHCGTPLYMSPEQCQGKPYSRAADVWAMGVVIWQMLTLKTPFLDMLGAQQPGIYVLMRIIQTRRLPMNGIRKQYGDEIAALTAALLSQKTEHRPSMEIAIRWPMFANISGIENGSRLRLEGRHVNAPRPFTLSPQVEQAAEAIQRSFKRVNRHRRAHVAEVCPPDQVAPSPIPMVSPALQRALPSTVWEPIAAPKGEPQYQLDVNKQHFYTPRDRGEPNAIAKAKARLLAARQEFAQAEILRRGHAGLLVDKEAYGPNHAKAAAPSIEKYHVTPIRPRPLHPEQKACTQEDRRDEAAKPTNMKEPSQQIRAVRLTPNAVPVVGRHVVDELRRPARFAALLAAKEEGAGLRNE